MSSERPGAGLGVRAAALRIALGALAGLAAGLIAAVGVFWGGLAFGWALVFGDGNGHEAWFIPGLTLVAALMPAALAGLGSWLAAPQPTRNRVALVTTAVVLGLTMTALAVIGRPAL